MIGGDRMVRLLRVVVSPFQPISGIEERGHTTMLRRRDVGAVTHLTLLSTNSPALSWCWAYLYEPFTLWPMLRLIPPQHFLLPLYHQGTCNCYFQTLNFHCHRPRPHSLSSSITFPPSAQQHLPPILNWSWSPHTFPSC